MKNPLFLMILTYLKYLNEGFSGTTSDNNGRKLWFSNFFDYRRVDLLGATHVLSQSQARSRQTWGVVCVRAFSLSLS
jgi:hypothetical protein